MELNQKIYKAIQRGLTEALDFSFDDEETLQIASKKKLVTAKLVNPHREQIWIQHNFVDLDLPSGTLWAKCNLGAESAERSGDYFAWGELEPKDKYAWDNYKYGSDNHDIIKYTNDEMQLELEDDAAYQADSRMCIPTRKQCDELIKETNNVQYCLNGVNGIKFTSKINPDNFVFIPGADYKIDNYHVQEGNFCCWTSETAKSFVYPGGAKAWCMYYDDDIGRPGWGSEWRERGLTIRPVLKK